MFKVTNDDLILIFVIVTSGVLTTVYTVDIRLQDGQAENQGRVEVRRNEKEMWGKVCDVNFGEEAADVVCRQLNFKYSRNDRGVYLPDYPDYRLENINCEGNETDLGDCIDGEWVTDTGICNTKTDAYASVCCSNSPIFGEMRGDMFVSHCADGWIDAEETCEGKDATLATVNEYTDILGSVPRDHRNDGGIDGYWTKGFFTPWVWSNGCFEFKTESFDHHEFNLQHNTAQACLQMCSLATPPSSFLLSDNFCRCLPTESLRSYIREVLPGWCNRKCQGDTNFVCGSTSRSYWSLYTVASENIFFKISDPGLLDYQQCAVLEASRKLSSEDCYSRNGYICSQILQENSTLPKLMFFRHSRFYVVVMMEARRKCTSDDTTMRLIGERILEHDIKFSQQYFHLWVDISRLLTHVYTINWQPENRKEISQWRNLEPRWCLARRPRGKYFSDEITECRARFRYICSMNHKTDKTSGVNGSSDDNGTDSGSMMVTIIVAVCGTLVVLAAVVAVFLYKRSRRNRQDLLCCKQKAEEKAPETDYTATFDARDTSPEHVYDEIRSENIYHEVDTLLEHGDVCQRQEMDDLPACSQTDSSDPLRINGHDAKSKDGGTFEEVADKQF